MLTKIDPAKIAPATPAPTFANFIDVKSLAAKDTEIVIKMNKKLTDKCFIVSSKLSILSEAISL